MSKKRIFAAIVLWCLTLVWAVFIFVMSAKTSQESDGVSGGVIRLLAGWFVPDFGSMSEAQAAEFVEGLQNLVRKLGHLSEFALLGCLLCSSLRMGVKGATAAIWAFVIGSVYGISDEIHQLFVPGRACQITDMLIDSLGGLLGVLFITAVVWIYKKIKRRV